MRYALSAEEMRVAEEEAVALGCGALAELMDRAGAALTAEVIARVPEGQVTVVCGPGNNGGDGWVAARLLAAEGRDVRVVGLKDPEDLVEPARSAARKAIAAGVSWRILSEVFLREISAGDASQVLFGDSAVVVDAVFGFGFRGPARGIVGDVLKLIAESGSTVISADVPSGVNSDTGTINGPAVRADVTVTFSAFKSGLLIYPGAEYAGEIVVADVGVFDDIIERNATLEIPSAADLRPLLPLPHPCDHKGSRGRVAIVAGSRAYAGAAILAAQGALRMGAGYVYVIAPEPAASAVVAALPNVIVRAVPADVSGAHGDPDAVFSALAGADAIVAGPGLTTASSVGVLISELIARVQLPMVLDADALNVLADQIAILTDRKAPLLLTPHPGEAARLLGETTGDIQADRIAAVRRLTGLGSSVSAAGITCLLKGPRTLVAGQTLPEEQPSACTALVCAGNAGLARAGSGDVLSGMLGTLLAQGLSPFDAAILGAHLHGRAAEYGTAVFTETCFTSTDITDFLPDAVHELLDG